MASSSYSPSKLLRRRAIIIVVVCGCLLPSHVTAAKCSVHIPKLDPNYPSYVAAVLTTLVDQTPAQITAATRSSYQTWSPDEEAGSVKGIATCFTTDATRCSDCLNFAASALASCVSTYGSSREHDCLIQFWRINH
ncbi:unnamed protein product [Linum tenue]|uniref:Gnk2-homologous domain-containing protein n=1 Tax=Linum tenue TaxID=586396 RepID=A0AAV0HQM1_9ROSI|nr:unnamed protein product [Linum tenue]